MVHQAVDARSGTEKTALERSKNLGDPREDDAKADAENDVHAGRPIRGDGKHGKGAIPIEGTSATNLPRPDGSGGMKCGNPYVGYGQCGGIVDEARGQCTVCGIPTRDRWEPLMPLLHMDTGTPNGSIQSDGAQRLPAHEKEAMRQAICREVTATVFEREKWDPDAMASMSAMPPQFKKKWADIQKQISDECEKRYRMAGLTPRRPD